MKVVKNHYAIYHTEESAGEDICIKDDIGRYVILYHEQVEEIIEDLVRFMNYRYETDSVHTKFTDL